MLNSNTARLIHFHITNELLNQSIAFDDSTLTSQINWFVNRQSVGMVNIVANILLMVIIDAADVERINDLAPEIAGRVNRARLEIYS